MDDTLIKLYALKTYGEVGPKTLQSLLMRFGSPDGILGAGREEIAEMPRISERKADDILSASDRLGEAAEELALIQDAGINIISMVDSRYPSALLRISDPPPVMFYKGKLPEENNPSLAVIGTTKASAEGITAAVETGKILAERGISLISGLAEGIDASAHLGALKNNGYTAAVLGSGLLHIYPKENRKLAKMIEESGCLLSEYHPETRVSVGRLLSRNRIIVGLSSAVIVMEVSEKSSGTINGMKRAREQAKSSYLYDPENKAFTEDLREMNVITFNSADHLESLLEYITVDAAGDK
ncbi:MAG: hypothetical protein GF315_14785 [candidate division Zixibacteria bacterium]|nr:hypothetical protein [candidate division Zixibacteria bacterium]